MKKAKKSDFFTQQKRIPEAVECRPLEVTLKECNFDTTKMIRRFIKKTRKEEVLKPFYSKLLYWETKGQKTRRKKLKSIYEHKRLQNNVEED
jgi:hypothetical protein